MNKVQPVWVTMSPKLPGRRESKKSSTPYFKNLKSLADAMNGKLNLIKYFDMKNPNVSMKKILIL